MGWGNEEEESGGGQQKPFYQYKQGVDLINFLPDSSVNLILLTGAQDKTHTWTKPSVRWVHKYKGAKNFVTLVSTNFEMACPIAFENELFKARFPNYKAEGKKLPYGIGKYQIVPVLRLDTNQTMYWIVGFKQLQQLDFLYNQNPTGFTNCIRVSRIGKGDKSDYRIDVLPLPADWQQLTQQATHKPLQELDWKLSREEYNMKIGIDPVVYWAVKEQEMASGKIPPIDISGWGMKHTGTTGMPTQQNYQPVQTGTISGSQSAGSVNQHTPQPWEQQKPNAVQGMNVESVLGTMIASGIHKGKTIKEAYLVSGEPFIKWNATAGNAPDNIACKWMMENMQACLDSMKQAF